MTGIVQDIIPVDFGPWNTRQRQMYWQAADVFTCKLQTGNFSRFADDSFVVRFLVTVACNEQRFYAGHRGNAAHKRGIAAARNQNLVISPPLRRECYCRPVLDSFATCLPYRHLPVAEQNRSTDPGPSRHWLDGASGFVRIAEVSFRCAVIA